MTKNPIKSIKNSLVSSIKNTLNSPVQLEQKIDVLLENRQQTTPLQLLCTGTLEERKNNLEQGKPYVSCLVAIYNLGERYVRACLESLVNQTLDNIEIILVNDASPLEIDDELCKEYAAKDKRIKYIKHEKNEGLKSARVTGLSAATGYSIQFIDGDDYLPLQACEVLFNQMIVSNVDIVTCTHQHFSDTVSDNSSIINIRHYAQELPTLLYGKHIFSALALGKIAPVVWGKLYNHAFLKKISKGIFEKTINLIATEDVLVNTKIFYHAKSLLHIDESLYFHRGRSTSSVNTLSEKFFNQLKYVFYDLYEYFSGNNFDVNYEFLVRKMANSLYFAYLKIRNTVSGKKEQRYFILYLDTIKKELAELFSSKIHKDTIFKLFDYSSFKSTPLQKIRTFCGAKKQLKTKLPLMLHSSHIGEPSLLLSEKVSASMPVISAILYVHAVGKESLFACIESILNQTAQNLEIILINDASTEEDITLCAEYALKHARIKYLQNNSSLGFEKSCLRALQEISGNYAHFIDCREGYFALHAYETLTKLARISNSDIIEFDYFRTRTLSYGIVLEPTYKKESNPGTLYAEDIQSLYNSKYEQLPFVQLFRVDKANLPADNFFDFRCINKKMYFRLPIKLCYRNT